MLGRLAATPLLLIWLLVACGPVAAQGAGDTIALRVDALGIEIIGLRMSSGGYMLDLRYRVLDPEKAKPLFDHRIKPFLTDAKTGSKFGVPVPGKIGALRNTSRSGNPKVNKVYFTIFANPGRFLKPGAKVSVVVGDYRIDDLMVE